MPSAWAALAMPPCSSTARSRVSMGIPVGYGFITNAALWRRRASYRLTPALKEETRIAVQARYCTALVEIECALYRVGLIKTALNRRVSVHAADDVVENCAARGMNAGDG